MYDGKIERGMVARLTQNAKLYRGTGGCRHVIEGDDWAVARTDSLDVVLVGDVASDAYIETIFDFRANLLSLDAPDGTRLWPLPVDEKTPEPVLALAWLREHIPDDCEDGQRALEWLCLTVPHTHPTSRPSGHTKPIIHPVSWDLTAQWPLPAVIAALRKAGKWEWLRWLYRGVPEVRAVINKGPVSDDDYPPDRVKELERELVVARENLITWNSTGAKMRKELVEARKEIERLRQIFEIDRATIRSWKKLDCERREELDDLREQRVRATRELARRDRLEAEMAVWFQSTGNLAKRFGTPEARAKFEKEKGDE